jgi:hypothetical protein
MDQTMSQQIHFSGKVGPISSGIPGYSRDVSGLVQEFFHYLGHIWVQNFDPPQSADELARFAIGDVIEAYRVYRAARGAIPMDDGLDLVSSYLVAQIIARAPLICLLNNAIAHEDATTTRMARVRALSPQDLIAFLQGKNRARLNTHKDIGGQIRRWGALCPMYTTLVYDGEIGHCIVQVGVEHKSERLIIWDPWPLRSLLCQENNRAGVAADAVTSEEPFWTVSSAELSSVLYAIFIPA